MAAIKWLDTPELNKDPVWQLDILPNKLTDAQWQQIDAAVKRFAPALAQIDQADGRQAADWKVEFKSPAIQILLPSLNGARHCANLLRMAALSSHRAGRHDETVHRLTQMALLARHVDHGNPALVGHLVASGIVRLTTETIKDVTPTLMIAPRGSNSSTSARAAPAPAAEGAASRPRVDALIATLLDPRTLQQGWARCAVAERMYLYDTYDCLMDGRLTMEIFAPPRRRGTATATTTAPTPPAGELLAELAPLLDYVTAMLDAPKADRLPEYRARLPRARRRHRRWRVSSCRTTIARPCRITSRWPSCVSPPPPSRCAYAADHNGAFPPSLNELVPQYLPAVPADPLVAAPATILYRDGMVYSAGVDERKSPTARSAAAATRAVPVRPEFFIRVN